MGDIATFSLQQTKHITCGEGGFVLTRSEGLGRRARLWADKGWNYDPVDPDHEFLGLNYRMSELQGAVALAQLRKLRPMVEHRVRMAERLRALLAEVPGVEAAPDDARRHPDLLAVRPSDRSRELSLEVRRRSAPSFVP